jgi:CheY-like chemotaxis protein
MHQNSHSILLVEDDADDRYLMHLAFSELGYEDHVKVFDSAEAFLRYLQSLPDPVLYPSLVVIDFNMPGMNGGEVLMRLQMNEALRTIPVAMYSTGMPTVENKLKIMGASYCFEKGLDIKDVFGLAKTLKEIAEGEEVAQRR